MRRVLVAVFVLTASGVAATVSAGAASVDVGTVTRLASYNAAANELPEGVAVTKTGRIYLSFPFTGHLLAIERDGSEHVVAHLPTGNGFGPLGLAVDARGTVYVGVVTLDPATQGVYRVGRDGAIERLPGTGGISFANGVAFGDGGELFVTDSMAGAVWRTSPGGTAEMWATSPLLQGDGSGPLPFPLGANGVAYRHGTLYVTNTEKGSVVAIPVLPDGSAGQPTIAAQSPLLGGADGIALDVHGDIYVAVIAQSTVVRIGPSGSMSVLAGGGDGLDYTSSIAFGSGAGDRTTIFAVNFSVGPLFGDVRTWGPALLAIEAGVPGLPQP